MVNFRIHTRDTVESVIAHVESVIDDPDVEVDRLQLFDLEHDPDERNDLADRPEQAQVLNRRSHLLADSCYGSDEQWIEHSQLVGEPDRAFRVPPVRGLLGQRGWR